MKKNLEVIQKELESLFPYAAKNGFIIVEEYGDTQGRATVSQEYSYVEITFDIMNKLREIFEGEFNIDQHAIDGCETCEYGSSYTKEFYFERN